jgi:hypothetical protein
MSRPEPVPLLPAHLSDPTRQAALNNAPWLSHPHEIGLPGALAHIKSRL